ncbi:MAG: bifunctional phosphoribosylaminoimidazolecarboxamide formyltransferase/IMP cyclohydrolase [Deltaproteobacteria bacterium]|nr:MAG: bifunctional phosphoribosylaminoimidazolecarboxamide formyltransferase/IMP cyclohydrolase [Deltaproteobacteria bacterium]
MTRARLVVLASGHGSNLQALVDACAERRLDADVVAVLTNRAGVYALERAHAAGIPHHTVLRRDFPGRAAFDGALAKHVALHHPDIIVLAGWMHVLGPEFLDRFPGRVINLHPALPGRFPGMNAIARAWEAARDEGLAETGVMVHYAVPEVDAGPVLVAEALPLDPAEPLDALEARVHALEHRLVVEGTRLALAELWGHQPPPRSWEDDPVAPSRAATPRIAAPTDRLHRSTSMTPRRALLSVYDKSGLVDFARGLVAQRFELIASGGTARALTAAGVPVTEVADVTGSPEVLGGRVKTLHPAIHAGILSRRSPADRTELQSQGFRPIDLVVVNLYPFADTIAKDGVTEAEAIEQIDIGGVTLLRAAAKNWQHVTIAPSPDRYDEILAALAAGADMLPLNRRLALEAFRQTARYDRAIAGWLAGEAGPVSASERLELSFEKVQDLRYGENPHQKAALYRAVGTTSPLEQLGGKELSFNNLVDLDAARALVAEFDRPTIAIVKHTNPCGLASAELLHDAFVNALAGDPVSAFGSIVAANRPVDMATVDAIGKLFVEVIVAPGFTADALAELRAKKKACRLIAAPVARDPGPDVKRIADGVLIQDTDRSPVDPATWQVVSAKRPDAADLAALAFAWRAVKHVKSNAIVLARGEELVGVGAGQMSRVDAVELAVKRAGERAAGSVLASDAFFPFPDGVEVAAAAGVRAIVQPGGSIRDGEVIAAADRLGLVMLTTGVRHFKH